MSKKMIFLATSLLAIGLLLFVIAMSVNGWSFKKLSTVEYETSTYAIDKDFSKISLNGDTEDVSLALSQDGTCKVVCFEEANRKHSVTVENGELKIYQDDKGAHSYLDISFYKQSTTVYLPKAQYESLFINVSTGDIKLAENLHFNSASIFSTTGDINISSCTFNSLNASTTTGDITLSSVICSNTIKINATTGDIKLNRCDSDSIYVKTTTGDISGSLLSEKTFAVSTTTGDIDVPRGTVGGICELKATTGDIKITIE